MSHIFDHLLLLATLREVDYFTICFTNEKQRHGELITLIKATAVSRRALQPLHATAILKRGIYLG